MKDLNIVTYFLGNKYLHKYNFFCIQKVIQTKNCILLFLDELSHQLHNNGAVALITQPHLLTTLNSAVELIKTTHKIDYKIDTIVTSTNVTSSIPPGVIHFKDLISDQIDHSELRFINRTKEDIAVLPYSSGTTGLSKGVQLTHRNCVSNVIQLETPDTYHFYPTTSKLTYVVLNVLAFKLKIFLCIFNFIRSMHFVASILLM